MRDSLLRAERLTLAVLMCGVAALALSDFVSPVYWLLSVVAALLRLWRGPEFRLSEMQASFVGWFGFIWVIFELFLGRALVVAFTDFLLILSFAIVVEAATPRNHLHRMLVGLFLVLAGAVLTDSVLYALPLFAMMWFLWRAAACLYGLNWQGGDLLPTPLRFEIRWMVIMLAISSLLFVALPRFEFHSLLKPSQPRIETSGFSDLVQLGEFARELDARVAMRVEPLDTTPAGVVRFRHWAEGRYWRGAVLSRFTGSGWQKGVGHQYAFGAGDDLAIADDGAMAIALYREASDHAYIQLPQGFARLRELPQAVRVDEQFTIQFMRPPSRRLRLLMDVVSADLEQPMRPPMRREMERNNTPDALKAWIASFNDGDGYQTLTRIADELRQWRYDLNAPIESSRPVASFLEQKRGHCELYATVLALAARELGIPARVVNGYLGGDWNEIGDFLLIRHLHAHSWVEVWVNDHWQRMDATPSARSGLLEFSFPTLEQVWESVKLGWYRYVLEFQNSDRIGFIRSLWQSIRQYAEWLLYGLLVVAALFLLRSHLGGLRLKLPSLRGADLWPELDRWLAQRGVTRPIHLPLRCTAQPDGVSHSRWCEFVQQWEAQVYGSEASWSRRELKRHLRALLRRC